MAKKMSMCRKDWLTLLKAGTEEDWDRIKVSASAIKNTFYGNEVFLRGIIEFSNHCRKNCLYCGIRKDSRITRYRLTETQILRAVNDIYNANIRTVVLQSGEDLYYNRKKLTNIIRKIKSDFDITITLSIGERPVDDYRSFFDAGAERFLIKHETSNPVLYRYFHPGESLKDRLKLVETLKKIGYQVGMGNIMGLPHTTFKDYVNDVFLIKAMDADMAGVGPFVASEFTPLAGYPSPEPGLVTRLIAMTRIVNPDINIPATTALFSVGGKEALSDALSSGANVLMPNFTPSESRVLYRLYDKKCPLTSEIISQTLQKLGLYSSVNKGDRRYAKCA